MIQKINKYVSKYFIPIFFLVLVFYSSPSFAYHFFEADKSGCRWDKLGAGNVDFIVDKSSTTIIGNAVKAEMTAVFSTWNNPTTAKDVFGNVTTSTVDFTDANFGTTWGIGFKAGTTVDSNKEVAVDEDGKIMALFGHDPSSVLGFAPTKKIITSTSCKLVDAYVVLNQTSSAPASTDRQSVITHELGHALGLAHSSVGQYNSKNTSASSGGYASPSSALFPVNITSAPTMHPFLLSGTNMRSLEQDDLAGLSELYPETIFSSTLGSITGKVTLCSDNNKKLQGVNVRAVNTSNTNLQVSRYTNFDSSGQVYTINGLPPGSYNVVVEAMGFNGFTVGRMAIKTTLDKGFVTEHYGPTAAEEAGCTESLPDSPLALTVAAGGSQTADIRVRDGVSIAYVVDDTGSMSSEISAVRTTLNNFINALEAASVPFPTVAIITFKDTVTTRIVSSVPAELRVVVNALYASGGADCPESANAALLEAGRLLEKNGKVVLFTDADSRPDGPNTADVTSFFRTQGISMSVLLSATCNSSFYAKAGPLDADKAFKVAQRDLQNNDTAAEHMLVAGAKTRTGVKPVSKSKVSKVVSSDRKVAISNAILSDEPAVLGVEDAATTFFDIANGTGGVFLAQPRPTAGDATTAYVNAATNISISSVLPTVGLVSPGNGPQGATLDIVVYGSNTGWLNLSELVFPGSSIVINSMSVASPTQILANITIPPSEIAGFVDVSVTTDLGGGNIELAEATGGFQVTVPTGLPDVVSLSPSRGILGQTFDVVIRALDIVFVDGTTSVDFGLDVTVNSIVINSSLKMVANLSIAETANTGLRDVVVTVGGSTATQVNGFQVVSIPVAIPRIESLSQSTLTQGQRQIALTITGADTTFIADQSIVDISGTGITVESFTVTSTNTIDAILNISSNASIGVRNVIVTTGDESAVILGGLHVVPMQIDVVNGTLTTQTGIDPDSITEANNRPDNIHYMVSLEVTVANPGDSATLTFNLPDPAPVNHTWWKYVSSQGWVDFTEHVTFNNNRTKATMTLVDGGLGDDGIADGVIVDPSGLAQATPTPTPVSSGGGGDGGSGGGCTVGDRGDIDPSLLFLIILSIFLIVRRRYRMNGSLYSL